MNLNYNRWKKLFLVALGLLTGTGFCMKWREVDLFLNGQKFTILGLEFLFPKEKVATIFK